jgi:hypothetical protein
MLGGHPLRHLKYFREFFIRHVQRLLCCHADSILAPVFVLRMRTMMMSSWQRFPHRFAAAAEGIQAVLRGSAAGLGDARVTLVAAKCAKLIQLRRVLSQGDAGKVLSGENRLAT